MQREGLERERMGRVFEEVVLLGAEEEGLVETGVVIQPKVGFVRWEDILGAVSDACDGVSEMQSIHASSIGSVYLILSLHEICAGLAITVSNPSRYLPLRRMKGNYLETREVR